MADPSPDAAPSNYSQADVLAFKNEYEAIQAEIAEASAARSTAAAAKKKLLARVKTAGITTAIFEAAVVDTEKSQEQREREARELALLTAFMSQPAGYQPSLDDFAPGASPIRKALTKAALRKIDGTAFDHGFHGGDRADNPYLPGAEDFVAWDTAFTRGVSSKELEGGDGGAAAASMRAAAEGTEQHAH